MWKQNTPAQVKARNRRNRMFAIPLSLFAVGVYFYTIFAVKSETFLDDFDVPTPPIRQKKAGEL